MSPGVMVTYVSLNRSQTVPCGDFFFFLPSVVSLKIIYNNIIMITVTGRRSQSGPCAVASALNGRM